MILKTNISKAIKIQETDFKQFKMKPLNSS